MISGECPKIEVKAARNYPLCLGVPLEELGNFLPSLPGKIEHILLISHEQVADRYAERLLKGLGEYRVDVLIVPLGEAEKSLERVSELTAEALRCGADRQTLVLALGGGVIGDLAGFFASVYMRGMRFLQIPTTLLAQVDSSIGGKVAVNHPAGKNIIGSFYSPVAVWTDFTTLESLPWTEVENGLAESIKHAIIADPDFFDFFETNVEAIKQRDSELWREMVIRSASIKVRIVTQDEREQGIRGLLNLGHSFGHAIETEMNYLGVTHGQGVSVGIVAAAHLAEGKGLLSRTDVERIERLLARYGLPTSIVNLDPTALLQRMQADKKNQNGRKILILPQGIGKAMISRDCTDEEILAAWQKVIQRA